MNFITSDNSLQVGDYVFHNYSKNNFLWKITKITRRFLTKDDIRYQVYKGGNISDEYNPYVEIESVADFGMILTNKKFLKKTRGLDAAYLIKADSGVFQDHIDKLNQIIKDFWSP